MPDYLMVELSSTFFKEYSTFQAENRLFYPLNCAECKKQIVRLLVYFLYFRKIP